MLRKTGLGECQGIGYDGKPHGCPSPSGPRIRVDDSRGNEVCGGLHDTTLDSVTFYDTAGLEDPGLWEQHLGFSDDLHEALRRNQLERTSRFDNIEHGWTEAHKLKAVRQRAYAFYEPRPEWNHTDNALVLVGSPRLYRGYHWDKRPFINNYDYRQDPEGTFCYPFCPRPSRYAVASTWNTTFRGWTLTAWEQEPSCLIMWWGYLRLITAWRVISDRVCLHRWSKSMSPYACSIWLSSPQLLQKILANHSTLAQWVDHTWVWLAALDPVDRCFYRVTSLSVSPINLMP